MNELAGFERPVSPPNPPHNERELGRNPLLGAIRAGFARDLKSAALFLRRNGPQSGEMADYFRQTSRWLENAGGYIEEADIAQVSNDLRRQLRAHPGRSLLIAGAVGLIVGTIVRRK